MPIKMFDGWGNPKQVYLQSEVDGFQTRIHELEIEVDVLREQAKKKVIKNAVSPVRSTRHNEPMFK